MRRRKREDYYETERQLAFRAVERANKVTLGRTGTAMPDVYGSADPDFVPYAPPLRRRFSGFIALVLIVAAIVLGTYLAIHFN